MKALRRLKMIGIMVALLTGENYLSEAFARSESITTHATIVILPSAESAGEAKRFEGAPEAVAEKNEMVRKVNVVREGNGEKLIFTSASIL